MENAGINKRGNVSSDNLKSFRRKGLTKEDIALLQMRDHEDKEMEERRNQLDCKRKFIYIPIDRRFLGLTQKERDEIKKNDPNYYFYGKTQKK